MWSLQNKVQLKFNEWGREGGIRGSIAEFGGVINDFLGGGGDFAAPMLDILVYMIPHDNLHYNIISA